MFSSPIVWATNLKFSIWFSVFISCQVFVVFIIWSNFSGTYYLTTESPEKIAPTTLFWSLCGRWKSNYSGDLNSEWFKIVWLQNGSLFIRFSRLHRFLRLPLKNRLRYRSKNRGPYFIGWGFFFDRLHDPLFLKTYR